jgi:hypothetical protein
LAARILQVEGFATFRYGAGFCHEPDPEKPLAVAEHGNKMADRDALLPRLPAKALKGVFAKTHLVTLLQLYKAGALPDLARAVASHPASSQAELQDVLDHGIFMEVFPWSAVRDHREDLVALMASNNFDNGHGLAESEIRVIERMRVALLTLPVPVGQTQFDVVCSHVHRLAGQRWHEKDLDAFWDFAQSTLDDHLELLGEIWTFAGCESVLRVDSAFFKALARLPAKYQWIRTALAVCQFLSDQEKECTVVRGSYIAGAVSRSQLSRLAAQRTTDEQKASSQDVEEFLSDIMARYHTPWKEKPEDAPGGSHAFTKSLTAFLLRAGRLLANDRAFDAATCVGLESKLRASWGPAERLPLPVVASSQGAPESRGPQAKATQAIVVTKKGGQLVVPASRLASEAGITLETRVVKKARPAGSEGGPGVAAPAVGVVVGISGEGVRVDWGEGQLAVEAPASLALAPKQPQDASASSQGLELPSVKWSPVSNDTNKSMLSMLSQSSLYQALLTHGALHADLHLVDLEAGDEGVPLAVYARKDYKERALVLLPFSQPFAAGGGARPANAVPLQTTIAPEGESVVQVNFWVKPRALPKRMVVGEETAAVLVPYFALALHPVADGSPAAEALSQEPNAELVYSIATLEVVAPAMKGAGRGMRSKVSIEMVCLTNSTKIKKGARLYVSQRTPGTLEELRTT